MKDIERKENESQMFTTSLQRENQTTLYFVSNETKDEDLVQHRDVVESRAIAHMKDIEKLFFVLKFHESRSNSLSFTKI